MDDEEEEEEEEEIFSGSLEDATKDEGRESTGSTDTLTDEEDETVVAASLTGEDDVLLGSVKDGSLTVSFASSVDDETDTVGAEEDDDDDPSDGSPFVFVPSVFCTKC